MLTITPCRTVSACPPDLSTPWLDRFATRAAAAVNGTRAVLRLHGRIVRYRNRDLRGYGLTSARMRILEVIGAHGGSSISEIARRLDLSRQAVHRVVHDLVALGLLRLHARDRDRRARIPMLNRFGEAGVDFAVTGRITQRTKSSRPSGCVTSSSPSIVERISRRLECAAAEVQPRAELLDPGGGP